MIEKDADLEEEKEQEEQEKNDNNQISESQIKISQSENIEKDIINNLNLEKEENKIENNKEIKEKNNKIKNKEMEIGYINNITEENLILIKSKKNELEKKYFFSNEYSEIIFDFINYVNDLLYEQISNFIKENLNNISFFDTLSKI